MEELNLENLLEKPECFFVKTKVRDCFKSNLIGAPSLSTNPTIPEVSSQSSSSRNPEAIVAK